MFGKPRREKFSTTTAATERNFEIIGEAVGRLAKLDAATASKLSECQQIISFRNLLNHGYDLVDDAQVWEVIGRDLPKLEAEVEAILGETSSD